MHDFFINLAKLDTFAVPFVCLCFYLLGIHYGARIAQNNRFR